jgi:hypothetical protein
MTERPGQALQIYDARERSLVRAADLLLSPLAWMHRYRGFSSFGSSGSATC